MSDVEKAISSLAEDEELLQKHQQHQQQQRLQQQQSTTPLNQINTNNYNLQNEAGNTSLLQKQSCHNETQHPHHHSTYQQLETNTNTNYKIAKQGNCLSRIAKLIFSTPGLVVMVVAYTIMGAFIFPLLEAPQDISKSALIAKSREECLKELWIITEKLNVLYERNWTMLVHEQLRRFEGTIVAATRNMASGATTTSGVANNVGVGSGDGYGMATETTTTSLGRYGGSNLMEYSDLAATRWSFSEALLYSVTVITTIGHGSLTPRTAGGKIATIFYALIGVPLMLMCLSSLGALLAEALQCTYARLCCRWPQYIMENSNDLDHDLINSKPLQTQRSRRQTSHTRKAEKHFEKETTHQIKNHLHPQCDFQRHKDGINCKNCKYDAIIGETNTNHGYDYKLCNDATTTATSSLLSTPVTAAAVAKATTATPTTITTAMPTIKLGHKEDCCQLLQSSPGKFTQHLSSCMQLKMSPTITGAATDTTTIATTVQQQHYQQRPDVMLMTNGHKFPSQQAAPMATACQLVLPPSQTQRFYTNATPAIATYHLVSSASANSSPTHHQSIRHYIVPQLPPPPPLVASSSTSVTGAQHFMAVPSTMVRFHHQASPQTSIQQQQKQQPQQQQQLCGVNTTSSININPLALPVSSSTTVYFPIVTPAVADSQASSQPLVKYHTIQMPHKRQHGLSLFQQTDLHDNQAKNDAEDVDSTSFTPPPPPAYQTATVHGIRRAKFLTKPLPQEINTLLQESDISCRHDLSQNLTRFNNSNSKNSGIEQQQQPQAQQHTVTTNYNPTTHSTIMLTNENGTKLERSIAATTAVDNFYGNSKTTTTTASSSTASTATLTINTNTNNATNIYENHEAAVNQQSHVVNNSTGFILATRETSPDEAAPATVNIMEDEEEQEQQRLGEHEVIKFSRHHWCFCIATTNKIKYIIHIKTGALLRALPTQRKIIQKYLQHNFLLNKKK